MKVKRVFFTSRAKEGEQLGSGQEIVGEPTLKKKLMVVILNSCATRTYYMGEKMNVSWSAASTHLR